MRRQDQSCLAQEMVITTQKFLGLPWLDIRQTISDVPCFGLALTDFQMQKSSRSDRIF